MKRFIYALFLLVILAFYILDDAPWESLGPLHRWLGPVVANNWEKRRDAGALFYTDVKDFNKILKDLSVGRRKARQGR